MNCVVDSESNLMFSYLVFMDLQMAEYYKDCYDEFDRNPTRRTTIQNTLYKDMLANGNKVVVENREIFTKTYSFNKNKDCKFDDSFGLDFDMVDFKNMVEREVWAYIYGHYLLQSKLSTELNGFSSIQID